MKIIKNKVHFFFEISILHNYYSYYNFMVILKTLVFLRPIFFTLFFLLKCNTSKKRLLMSLISPIFSHFFYLPQNYRIYEMTFLHLFSHLISFLINYFSSTFHHQNFFFSSIYFSFVFIIFLAGGHQVVIAAFDFFAQGTFLLFYHRFCHL